MYVTFSPCNLIATCLFAVSLFLPSFANAEQQEELAPGFNACIKRTEANANSDDSESRQTYLQCYRDAGDYWKNIFETEYKKETDGGDYYSGDFAGDDSIGPGRYELQMLRLAWEQYFDAFGALLSHEAANLDPRYLTFRAEEYKKIVQALRGYGVFSKPEKTAQDGLTQSFSN